ncbi:MAG: type II secretion system protein N, partial [Cellvibrionales bacterium]|nr:type II secretion system protein N [Cellvibrionales bacterium]
DIKDQFRFLTGSVRFDLIDHDIHLKNIKGRVDGTFVQPYLNLPFKVEGLADIDIKAFENIDKVPKTLNGRIIIESLKINMGQEVFLGTFAADLSLLDDQPVANVKLQDVQADVELNGFAQFTTALDYYVNIKVKPKSTANPLIDNTLRSVYRADDQGWYSVMIGKPFKKIAAN